MSPSLLIMFNIFCLAGIVCMILTYVGVCKSRWPYNTNLVLCIATVCCPFAGSIGFMCNMSFSKAFAVIILFAGFAACIVLSFKGTLDSWDNTLNIALGSIGSACFVFACSIIAHTRLVKLLPGLKVDFYMWFSEGALWIAMLLIIPLTFYACAIIGFYSSYFTPRTNQGFIGWGSFFVFCVFALYAKFYLDTIASNIITLLSLILFISVIISVVILSLLDPSSWIGGTAAYLFVAYVAIKMVMSLSIMSLGISEKRMESLGLEPDHNSAQRR